MFLKGKSLILVILLIAQMAYGQSVDSLILQVESAEEREKIDLLHQIIIKKWLNYPDQAMIYAHDALNISKRIKDQAQVSKSFRLLAGVHYYKGDYTASLDYNTKALDIALNIPDSALINNCYNNIGLIYFELGSHQNSLENLLRSKIIKDKIGETYGMSTTLNNIGLVYNSVGDFVKAREYFFEALNLSKDINDNDQLIYSLNNVGFTYIKEQKLLLARDYFDQTLAVTKVIDNKNREAAAWRGVGEIMFYQGAIDSAKYYYQYSLDLRNEIGEQKGVSEIYYLQAKVAYQTGRLKQAVELLGKSQVVAQRIGARDRLLEIFQLFMTIYLETDQKNLLALAQKDYINLRDSLYYDGVYRNISLIPVKLKEETDNIKLLNQQRQIESDQFRNRLYIGIILLATPLIIFLWVLYRRNKVVKDELIISNMDVRAKNEEIQTQKEVLVANNIALESARDLIHNQKEELQVLNEELEKKVDQRTVELNAVNKELRTTSLELDNLIYKSSHDIRGPLLRILGVCHLALMEIKDSNALAYFKMVDKASKRLNNIVDKLKIVSEINNRDFLNEKIDFMSLINENLKKNKYIEGLEDLNLEIDLIEDLAFYSDPSLIDLIIFNMIQNAVQLLKGSQIEAKKMKISVSKDVEHLIMMFDVENVDLVINKHDDFYKVLIKDDDDQQSLGIGLYTVKQCVQKLEGELLLLGDNYNVTRFTINLPLHVRL
jgi:signal transduction histidine kinase/Tfp pilus assembly protein PilF